MRAFECRLNRRAINKTDENRASAAPADVEFEIGCCAHVVNKILCGEAIIIRARVCECDACVAAELEHVCAFH